MDVSTCPPFFFWGSFDSDLGTTKGSSLVSKLDVLYPC